MILRDSQLSISPHFEQYKRFENNNMIMKNEHIKYQREYENKYGAKIQNTSNILNAHDMNDVSKWFCSL